MVSEEKVHACQFHNQGFIAGEASKYLRMHRKGRSSTIRQNGQLIKDILNPFPEPPSAWTSQSVYLLSQVIDITDRRSIIGTDKVQRFIHYLDQITIADTAGILCDGILIADTCRLQQFISFT